MDKVYKKFSQNQDYKCLFHKEDMRLVLLAGCRFLVHKVCTIRLLHLSKTQEDKENKE